ncbi:MAG TPA: hypothetical protein VNE71_17495 [Myxococcota bacterium]|nr:hypothetical protein [Myxococcota bacterium]
MRRRKRFAAVLAGLVMAAPAVAIESINGTYEGKVRCRENAAGTLAKTKQDLLLRIVGDAGIFNLDVVASGELYAALVAGTIVEHAGKPDRATLAGVDCELSAASGIGSALHAEIAIKPGSEQGTVKGTLLRLSGDGGATSELCTFTAKRTSTALPSISACPP